MSPKFNCQRTVQPNTTAQMIAEAFAIIAYEKGKAAAALRLDLHWLEYSLLDFTEEDNLL